MSNDEKKAATGQTVDDDDEPDDWYVQWSDLRVQEGADDGTTGTRGSSAPAAQVCVGRSDYAEML